MCLSFWNGNRIERKEKKRKEKKRKEREKVF